MLAALPERRRTCRPRFEIAVLGLERRMRSNQGLTILVLPAVTKLTHGHGRNENGNLGKRFLAAMPERRSNFRVGTQSRRGETIACRYIDAVR